MQAHKLDPVADFLQKMKVIRSGLIVESSQQVAYEENVTAYSRRIVSVLRPRSNDELKQIVIQANQFHVALSPFSSGKNWGLGSRLPYTDGQIIVDLSEMNQILHYDAEFGIVKIQPGVTQGQLSQFLIENNSKFFMDVTGSGLSTSILGNALERGIAYHRERAASVTRLKVLLGNGEFVESGFSAIGSGPLDDLYSAGIGPGTMNLFFQSNYGIVVDGTISLMKVPEHQEAFLLQIPDSDCLYQVIEILRKLKAEGILDGIPHIANQRRREISILPALAQRLPDLKRESLTALLGNRLSGGWSGVGCISGPKKIVRLKAVILNEKLKKHCSFSTFSENKIKLIIKFSEITNNKVLKATVESMLPTMRLALGVPNDSALRSIYWPQYDKLNYEYTNPDLGTAGIIFMTPMIPATTEALKTHEVILRETFHYSKAAVTLNLINQYTLEGVVSIDFNKLDPASVSIAHDESSKYLDRLVDAGLYPYRIDVNNMNKILERHDVNRSLKLAVKEFCDPNNIIAPGRYVK